MMNAVVYYKWWYFPYVYGQFGYYVTGDVGNSKDYRKKSDSSKEVEREVE